MPRLHPHAIGGISLVLGALILVVAQVLLLPPLTTDAAEQLTIIARTGSWAALQQASLAALPLLLIGTLSASARAVAGGARSWGWLGGGLSIFGASVITFSLCFFAGSAESTRTLVSENAPIDSTLLAAYRLLLPSALVAQSWGWLALGLGVALIGRALDVGRVVAEWVAGTVSVLALLGALLTLARDSTAGMALAEASVLAAALILAGGLIVAPASGDH